MQYPINEMFQTLQGEGYFTGVPAILFVYRDVRLAVPGATPNTREKLEDREVSLFSILAKTKESDKWGRRAVKICWLSLAVRDTLRVMW